MHAQPLVASMQDVINSSLSTWHQARKKNWVKGLKRKKINSLRKKSSSHPYLQRAKDSAWALPDPMWPTLGPWLKKIQGLG
jgi:hypothetical protein